MRFPVTSAFGLAASTLETIFRQFIPLLTAFILPDFGTRLLYFTEAWLSARANSASYFPFWFTESVDLFLSSIVFVSIIRFLVLGERPQLFFSNLPLKAVILTTLVLVPVWLILYQVADQSSLYSYYLESQYRDDDLEMRFHIGKIIGLYSFVAHTLAIAIFYPFLGHIATTGQLDFKKVTGWYSHSFPGILLLAALLIASVSMVNSLYWSAIWAIIPDTMSYRPAAMEFFYGRIVAVKELLHLPIAFFYDVIPPIAIALLMIGFSKEKVQMSTDPSVVAD